MSTEPILCCDASIVVTYVSRIDRSAAHDLWERWAEEKRSVVAPLLMRYEVTNAIHRIGVAAGLTESESVFVLESAFRLPITFHAEKHTHMRAFEISRRFKLPAAYDAHYLALAEALGCDFYTADARLYRAVGDVLHWVKFV